MWLPCGVFRSPRGCRWGIEKQYYQPFFPESQVIIFPTLPQGLTRNLFHAPDFVFPPFLYSCFPCRVHLQMISLVCILSLAACPPIYQVSAARHRLALSSHAPLFLLTQGKVCVWGREGRWVSPTAPGPGAGSTGSGGQAAQLGRHNYMGRLTAPPPRLALTDDLAGTAALGLPTDISWYNGLDWTCHTENVGGR